MNATRALLVTDVVDSTRMSEELGDAAMARVWAAHDRVARDLLPQHRGREIDKTDGFLLLFEAVDDAVAYAVAYHAAIRALSPPLRARAGVHVGPVILTENAPADVARGAKPLEVDGIAKPTAARVMSVALGGQTLLTRDAREALGVTSLRVGSHGHWRMKGVAEPIELFEVGDADAPMLPPPDGAKVYRVVRQQDRWLPARAVPNNLPAERDSFVGRVDDLTELDRRLGDGARLVSVLGIGGSGKTRLVVRFGWTWLGDHPGGVWFCDLSEARSQDDVTAAVAGALGLELGAGDPVARVGFAIAGRGPCLVILDNFEQVARWAADTLGRWLDRAPEARFVVTSREVLGLAGEQALLLAPMRPDDGVDLFVARAQAAKRDFALTEADRSHVAELVRLLDALPLAIELAAARVRVMPPRTLLQRMGERFRLLASTGGRHARQATLKGALDWSWDLLSDAEKSVLAQLSVFEGGFDLETAEQVLDLSLVPDPPWTVDLVTALVDKSLVRAVDDQRLDLLVSVQEYAAERLRVAGGFPGSGPEAERAAALRHAACFSSPPVAGPGAPRDLDNRIAACRRAARLGDGALAVATLRGAWQVLESRGPFARAVDLVEAVLASPGLSPEHARAAHLIAVAIHHVRADYPRALTHVEAAQRAHGPGDAPPDAEILASHARLMFATHEMGSARSLALQALEAASRSGDVASERTALVVLTSVEHARPDLAAAEAWVERALALVRRVGDRRNEAVILGSSGVAHLIAGKFPEALVRFEAALATARAFGDRALEAGMLCNIGNVHLHRGGGVAEAVPCYEAALPLAQEIGHRDFELKIRRNLARALGTSGRSDAAIVHLEASMALSRAIGVRGQSTDTEYQYALALCVVGRYAEAEPLARSAVRAARDHQDHHSEGAATRCLAWIELVGGRPGAARDLLSSVRGQHLRVGGALGEHALTADHGLAVALAGDPAAGLAWIEQAQAALGAMTGGVDPTATLAATWALRAVALWEAGDRAAAAAAMAEAEAGWARGGALAPPEARARLAWARARIAAGG